MGREASRETLSSERVGFLAEAGVHRQYEGLIVSVGESRMPDQVGRLTSNRSET